MLLIYLFYWSYLLIIIRIFLKKKYEKIFLFIYYFFICLSVSLKMDLKKKDNADEFLVEKKNPLVYHLIIRITNTRNIKTKEKSNDIKILEII